jgi:anhydro-N-acetylmuramic acid kinase
MNYFIKKDFIVFWLQERFSMIKNILKLTEKETIKVLGLMTGTSADGLDIACVEFTGYDKYPTYKVNYTDFIPYPKKFSEAFKRPLELTAPDIADFDMRLGKWYGEVISKLDIDYDVIANHGQTLLHQAPDYTLQIGEAQCIVEKCKKPVIYDFRTKDLVLGGQGAPLIPIVDEFLLRKEDSIIIALNMGGIANLSFLAPRSSHREILAWDTGPANTLIDKAVIDFTKGKELFDRDGSYARSGKVHNELFEELMAHDYLSKQVPKSAGQEQFGYEYYDNIKKRIDPQSRNEWLSFIRTLTEFTIMSISRDILALIKEEDAPVEIIASGGGAENLFIMERLNEELSQCKIHKFDLKGVNSEIKEAFGFAYLGYLFLRQIPGNVPSVTGSTRHTVLGKIVF